MKAPVAKKNPLSITQHGYQRTDDYAWLRDENWQNIVAGDITFKNNDIYKYIEAENQYKDQMMEDTKDLQKKLYDEILSRIKEDDESYPYQKKDYYYYSREEKGKNYPIMCRKKGSIDASEEIFFDVNQAAEGKKLYMFSSIGTNESNDYFAYGYNLTGSMDRTLRVKDLNTGKEFDWEIPDTTGESLWVDDTHLYYVERDSSSRGKKVFKIDVTKGPESKKIVFEKPEEYDAMFMGLSQTNDRKYFEIALAAGSTQVIYLAERGSDEFYFFVKGEQDVTYSLEHYQGTFYISTNRDGAADYQILSCPAKLGEQNPEAWDIYIPEAKEQYIHEIAVYNRFLVLIRKNNKIALDEIFIHDLETKNNRVVKMPGEVYQITFEGAWDYRSTKVRVAFKSPIHPSQDLELNLEDSSIVKLHEKDVPNYDSSQYVLKREFAKARDGKDIPLTIVHKKDLDLDGSHPAFVYAYGSYGYGMPAYFSSTVYSLVDRGFVYCIAHIRGGDDKGNSWYLDGKMDKKLNTFNDFIDSCEHLVERKYTSEQRIAINGGSAGGLLMGAVTNMRPDLFGCVVADVPFVDVINTISDDSLPLTPPEWEEWGNPITSKSDYEYMMKYSPYDNIEKKSYPPMLYNSGISDEQVTYWEPTKMVAKLREMKTDDNLLLLNMKMHAGHAGASKRYEWIEEEAFSYAFILKHLG